jgi:hypothetical protein
MTDKKSKEDYIKPKILNIAQRMLAIVAEIGMVPKSGDNKFHKYKYATETDITNALSPLMATHGVYMHTTILEKTMERAGNQNYVSIKIKVKFINVDQPDDFLESEFYGDGTDSGDKGVYKAITGAIKYALLKTFLISTGDDPEKDNQTYSKNHSSEPNLNLIQSIEVKAMMGIEHLNAAWGFLTPDEKTQVRTQWGRLKEMALKADRDKIFRNNDENT